MISTERAREIAANPDGCDAEDLKALALYIGPGLRPMSQAAALFPNEVVEAIPGYRPTAPIGRLFVAKTLRAYCWNKLTAMTVRARPMGDIGTAMEYEAICERLYNSLPAWAKW